MSGTKVEVEVVRVVDGDTLRVSVEEREWSLRMLALDTEESNAGSDKPVTPWGRKAKERAQQIFSPGDRVTVEFLGNEAPEVCWEKYLDNFGRPLVFVHDRDDADYQEVMIREGYSPYFTKYGYAEFAAFHRRYAAAERAAQGAHIGVWDQMTVNGQDARNYAALGVWWELRARIIDHYRLLKAAHPEAGLLNSRLDYDAIVAAAAAQRQGIVFTELRELRRVGGHRAIITIGSMQQPFKVFLPDLEGPAGQAVVRLLENRYFPSEPGHPRRSYAYVHGPMKLFRDEPEIVVTSSEQISDEPPL
jgi:micrococcal nuclease